MSMGEVYLTFISLVKLKIAQKQPTAYWIVFCCTDRSKLSQKVIQRSFLSLFVIKFFSSLLTENLSHARMFLSKKYLQTTTHYG